MIHKSFWKNIKYSEENNNLKLEKFIIDNKNKEKIIEIKNLKQVYKNSKNINLIFDNVNFNIYKNDRLAIIGGNGAGKTTIVEIISGYKKQTSGTVNKFFTTKKNNSSKISVQFQDLSFPKNLSVKDIIKFIVEMDNLKISEEELKEMLDVFLLSNIIDKKVSKLSGGQQQRLNVILSLISKPELLFLDEFTTGLDIAIKHRIKKFILKYCKDNKITFVIISHDIEIMNEMVDRVVLIANKQLLVDASIEEINKKFGSLNKMTNIYIN